MGRLLAVLFACACLVCSCGHGPAAQATPAPLLPATWEGVQLQTLCLEVEQSYPEVGSGFSLPVERALQRLLPRLGLRLASGDQQCEASLRVAVRGEALAEDYLCILGKECGHCFTGAQVTADLTLTGPGRTSWADSRSATISPPSTISECPDVPNQAPLDEVWPRAVLAGMVDLWGAPALVAALDDRDATVREAAVRLLQARGSGGVPLLIRALRDRNADVREWAARGLGSQGELAREAVPALIEVLDDGDRPARLAAAGALKQITGEDFGQDQATWRRWLKEPDLTPTVFAAWKGVPLPPGVTSPEELGSLLQFTCSSDCAEESAFFQAEMPGAGWAPIEAESPSSFIQTLKFEKERYTAEIRLHSVPVGLEESRCSVQIFVLR